MDYGKRLRLTYSDTVYHITDVEKSRFRIENAYGEYIYPIGVVHGHAINEVDLIFENINNLVFPASLECLGCIAMGSDLIPFAAFMQNLSLNGLFPIPGEIGYMQLESMTLTGELIAFTFVERYQDSAYMQLDSMTLTGDIIALIFAEMYQDVAYMQLDSMALTGEYCDIDGVPL